MKLALVTGPSPIFVAECAFEERAAPKAAGFFWHGGNCRLDCFACHAGLGRVWWTKHTERAARLVAYATPEAAAALAPHTAAVESSKATDATDVAVPAPEGLAYLPYQRAGVAYALARRSTLIGDEMGLGKTIQAIGVINADPSIRTVLVICPASLRLNWKRELERWLVTPRSIEVLDDEHPIPAAPSIDELIARSSIGAGLADLRARGIDAHLADLERGIEPAVPPKTPHIVIANYDRVRRPEVHAVLMARSWDVLICDEAHRIKNPKAKQTQAVLGKPADRKTGAAAVPGLVDRAARKLFLTGTPILNKPIELHPLLAAIAPEHFGNFFTFAKRYCDAKQVYAGRKMVWDFGGASHLEELQERLRATCMVRRLKADVLKELPPKRRQIVTLPCETPRIVEAELSAYDEIAGDAEAEAEIAHATGDKTDYEIAAGRLADRSKLAFTEISQKRHAVALSKVKAVLEHVDDALESTAKIILFAHHKDVIAKILEHYAAEGVKAVSITGDTASDDRQAAVDAFQTDPTVRLFVGSIGACCEGLTLTAASTVIFAELDWVPANVSQAEDRAHRIGQRDHVLVQHLVLEGSLDARMVHMILAKQAIADAALDTSTRLAVDPAAERAIAEREARKASTPKASDEQRAAALEVIRELAARCDGALQQDRAGFNRLDTRIGKRLAALPELTDGQVALVAKLATKYRGQLDPSLVAAAGGHP